MVTFRYGTRKMLSFSLKVKSVLGILLFLGLGFLNGIVNSNVTDYSMYESWYLFTGKTGIYQFERGYSFLTIWFYQHGFQYSQFRMFLSVFAMFIMSIAVLRFTDDVLLVSLLYGLSIYYVDAIQLRSQLMLAIVTLGLSFLQKLNKRNIILSTFIICLSTLFHVSGFFFLSVIPIRLGIEKYFNSIHRWSIVFSFCLVGIFFIFKNYILKLLDFLGQTLSSRESLSSKIVDAYANNFSFYILLEITIFILILLFSSYYLCRSIRFLDYEYLKKNYIIYSVLVFSMFTLPFLAFSVDYSRLQRSAVLFFYIQIAMSIGYQKSLKNRILLILLSIVVAIISFYIFLKVYGTEAFSSVPIFWGSNW